MYNKLNHEPIKGKRIWLRLLEESDIELIRLWRNRDDIRKWFKSNELIKPEQQIIWYEKYKSLDTDYLYIVEMSDKGKQPIGQISIYNVDWQAKKAEYGRVLVGNESARGKGLFYEASCLLFEFWKNIHGIENYFLKVKANNERAIYLYELLGFKKGREKDGFLAMQLNLKQN